jgi:chemotaxis signal transduction protein
MIERPDPVSLNASYAHFLEHLSDDEFWKLAAEAAGAVPVAPARADNYLVCGLRQGPCMLSLAHLREVVSPPYQFTRLPASPRWMLGITAWRGEMIAVIDLEAFLLDKNALPLADRLDGILLIASDQDIALGLLVSSVASTITLDIAWLALQEPVAAHNKTSLRVKAIKGIYDGQHGYSEHVDALVLDIPAILGEVTQNIRIDMPYE